MNTTEFSLNHLIQALHRVFSQFMWTRESPMAIANNLKDKNSHQQSLMSLAPPRQERINDESRNDATAPLNLEGRNSSQEKLHINVLDLQTMRQGYKGIDWLIEGLIQRGSVNFVFGPPGSKKSFFCLELAHAVASGREFFGCQLKQATTLYVCLEGLTGFKARCLAIHDVHGDTENLLVACGHINLTDKSHVSELLRSSRGAKLIVIDTLNAASDGLDENMASLAPTLLTHFRDFLSDGGSIVFIHHSGKGDTEQMRGSSSLLASADTAIALKNHGDFSSWRVTKMRDGSWEDEKAFQLVERSVQFNGENISMSATIHQVPVNIVTKKSTAIATGHLPKGGNIDLLLPLIQQMCVDQAGFIEESELITRCITALREKDTASERKPREEKILRQRTIEVLKALRDADCINWEDGKITLIA